MSFAQGRHYNAIPGPSVVPDRVLQAMHQAAPNIYSTELAAMVDGMIPDLRAVARTSQHVAIYIANGHGIWEGSVANIAAPGDTVLLLDTGHFSSGWAETARRMGVVVETLTFFPGAALDPARVTERLSGDAAHRIKAVLSVQVDTASSVRHDIPVLRAAMDAAGHPALLVVDCVASMGCETFEMDVWGVDVAITASQKGLMTPPGLAFIFFNDKAAAVRNALPGVSPYWDWAPRANPAMFYQYFCGTAPTHHLFALREALTMLVHEEGMEAAWARHAAMARAIWASADAWGVGGPLRLNVTDPACRSHAVTALRVGAPQGTQLRDWLTAKAGLTLGVGLGMAPAGSPEWHGYFRIGHMGHVNTQMILGALGAIEAGLTALDIPHGPGALEAAAAICARA